MLADHRRRGAVRMVGLVVAIAVLILSGCGPAGGVVIPGAGPLVTVSMEGGMCPEGACASSVILERDGRVHSAAKPPNDLGRASSQAMAALTAAIQATDYAAIKARPFTGVCPIAFDGQQLIFEFSVGAGTQRIASCEVDIDWGHPLFVAVGAALGEWIPIPLT